jgi:hypothetical protein
MIFLLEVLPCLVLAVSAAAGTTAGPLNVAARGGNENAVLQAESRAAKRA